MDVPTIRMFGATEKHALDPSKPKGDSDKPNEDYFIIDNDLGFAILADGVTRSRNKYGEYPKGSTIAPKLACEKVHDYIRCRTKIDTSPKVILEDSARKANNEVWQANIAFNIPRNIDYDSIDYLGTTLCVLWIHRREEKMLAVLGFIGDSIAIHIPKDGQARLLTRDQVAPCHRYSKPFFESLVKKEGLSQEAAKRKRLIFQRKEARNKTSARDPDGNLIGYGVLTGEDEAMNFLEIQKLMLCTGDKIIMASDAINVLSEKNLTGEPEKIEHYAKVIDLTSQAHIEDVPRLLIEHIRKKESEKNAGSDDATVVAIEVL